METEAQKKARIEMIKRVTMDGLIIQKRFKAEPVFSKTGVGYMASEGVEPLIKIKHSLAKR